jgi:hypothetical protein
MLKGKIKKNEFEIKKIKILRTKMKRTLVFHYSFLH